MSLLQIQDGSGSDTQLTMKERILLGFGHNITVQLFLLINCLLR